MRNDKLRLHFSTNFGTNGQLRLIESPGSNEAVFGFIFAHRYSDGVTDDDYFMKYYEISTAAVSAVQDDSYTLVEGEYKGKVRNTFGKYAVINKNMYQFNIYGYNMVDDDNVSLDLLYTTEYENSIQFMGSHEVYWFPYKEFLMARLADGRSYKYFRFTSVFDTISQTNQATLGTSEVID